VFNPFEISEWLSKRKDAPKKVKETWELLSGELMLKPLSDINIHLKLESLLKEEPISVF